MFCSFRFSAFFEKLEAFDDEVPELEAPSRELKAKYDPAAPTRVASTSGKASLKELEDMVVDVQNKDMYAVLSNVFVFKIKLFTYDS